ncbi:uncharacterized protein LOC143848791 [Tasmannia lanceolata]|uniref:uncharacterized protein LOC143848791 n=1 Tax=Tasmannia lanceolata TaxID=3420 RepID=UPI0040632A2F
MSMIRSLAFYNHHGPHLPSRYGSHSRNRNPFHHLEISTIKHGCWLLVNRGFQLTHVKRGELSKLYGMMGSNPPSLPPPSNLPKPNLHNWLRCIFGSIISIILPFWKQKEGELEKLEDQVENTAEVVEKVAEAMEKVFSDVADKLPSDGPLKAAALLVENIAKKVDKDAEETLEFIHKVDELKKDVEELVEPFVNQEDDEMKKEVEIDQGNAQKESIEDNQLKKKV